MKHLLIASTAILALSACGGVAEKPTSERIAEIAQSIETDKNLGSLTSAEAELTAIMDKARKTFEEASAVQNAATVAIGSAFLTKNGAAEGVVTTESGLQYKVIQDGIENGASADPGQGIIANYHGYFVNEEVFDSSYQRGRPLSGPSNGFIIGWNEALGEMKVCEARTLYIKSDLAYGDNGRGSIPGGATLLFNMQLLGVDGEAENGEINTCPEDKVLSGPESY